MVVTIKSFYEKNLGGPLYWQLLFQPLKVQLNFERSRSLEKWWWYTIARRRALPGRWRKALPLKEPSRGSAAAPPSWLAGDSIRRLFRQTRLTEWKETRRTDMKGMVNDRSGTMYMHITFHQMYYSSWNVLNIGPLKRYPFERSRSIRYYFWVWRLQPATNSLLMGLVFRG